METSALGNRHLINRGDALESGMTVNDDIHAINESVGDLAPKPND